MSDSSTDDYVVDSADEAFEGPLVGGLDEEEGAGSGDHHHRLTPPVDSVVASPEAKVGAVSPEANVEAAFPKAVSPEARVGAVSPEANVGAVSPEATVEEAEEAFEVADAALADAEQQRDEYLDALRHLQADFENYKKRMAKLQLDQLERAAESLVTKLLPVLDTADLAVAHGQSEEVAQLRGSLLDILGKEGLERIAPNGGDFDPHLHDAVAHEPGDGGDQEVAEVLRAGYLWNGRVLRPAMVKVRG